MGHKETEERISKFWEENKIFEKSVKERPKEHQYIFYDGPPFATGLPHYGHILGLTVKDIFPRYHTMKGKRCERVWGWDCHGLPIETIAEKELGIKDKKEIEEMGVEKFNEFCRSKVLFFAAEWKKTVSRMGKWIDFDNSYKTMDNTYMESVWHIFKKAYDDGYIYDGKKVLMYCPRCQTPLSNSEIAMDNSYKDVTEKTAIAKFKITDEDNVFILAWTTTPWTLIGNAALTVNKDLDYVKVKLDSGEFYILAKNLVEKVVTEEYEIIEEFKGVELIGKKYDILFESEAAKEKVGHYVIDGGSEVSAEDGTGVVHMAIYGEFDYEMIKKYDLPIIQHIDNRGKVKEGYGKFEGLWFKKADKLVLEDLEERNLLVSAEPYTHSYPFCYRCDTPLFYNAVDSWFVDIAKLKHKLLETNEDITWYPEHVKHGQFKHIVDNAPDWSISRNRYWASGIPVWKCDDKENCKHIEVIGSIKDLQEKAVNDVPDDVDLHKHIIDEIKLKCPCGSEMTRIPEVLDCWFESGSMPYASKHYPFENKDDVEITFPSDFISEYVGQVRAWFYYMHVVGNLMFEKAPFKNCLVTGNVLAEDGSKMSKSKKNFPDPVKVFDEFGADALRFYLMTSNLIRAQDLNFKEEGVKEIYRKVVMLLSNINRFYGMFGTENTVLDNTSSPNVLDKWIVSRTNGLVKGATEKMDNYDLMNTCTNILDFIDDLSTWYVRRSRDRFKSDDEADKKNATETLAYALYTASKVIAPIAPFITETIHLDFVGYNETNKKNLKESIHLESWPIYDESLIDNQLEIDMIKTRELVSKLLDERESVKIPIRQALSKATVTGILLSDDLLELVKAELNVKAVVLKDSECEEVTVELDTKLTPELIQEGVSRNLTRVLNNIRKKMGLTVDDRVKVSIETENDDILKAIENFGANVKQSVQADEIAIGILDGGDNIETVKVGKEEVKVLVEKV